MAHQGNFDIIVSKRIITTRYHMLNRKEEALHEVSIIPSGPSVQVLQVLSFQRTGPSPAMDANCCESLNQHDSPQWILR